MIKNRILVVEDDQDINNLLKINLGDLNYDVDTCTHGEHGLQKALSGQYHLLVLDVMLPEIDGLEICRRIRQAGQLTPILMLTAKDSAADRVVGLEMGADDYLVKPFSIRELQARVKALLRRVDMMSAVPAPQNDVISVGELSLDINKRQVILQGRQLDLTSTEFDLLSHLAKNPGRVFSRAQLLDQVWGYKHSGYEHTVNSHINRLRNKLEKNPANPDYVLTVWGVGYKLAEV